jgi:DNA-binding NarL/FixJ family response regulator
MKTRVLIADDHSIVRAGIQSLLAAREDIVIAGEADSGRSIVQMTRKLKPDLILMEMNMPDMNGIETINVIHRENADIKVLVLSMHFDDKEVAKALKAGARGYLIKNCDARVLNDAIDTVKSGNVYLSNEMSQSLIQSYIDKIVDDSSGSCILTRKEREILQKISEGNTTKEISGVLNVSVKTVEVHRSNIMNKLKLRNIADLTKYAIREGLTKIN